MEAFGLGCMNILFYNDEDYITKAMSKQKHFITKAVRKA